MLTRIVTRRSFPCSVLVIASAPATSPARRDRGRHPARHRGRASSAHLGPRERSARGTRAGPRRKPRGRALHRQGAARRECSRAAPDYLQPVEVYRAAPRTGRRLDHLRPGRTACRAGVGSDLLPLPQSSDRTATAAPLRRSRHLRAATAPRRLRGHRRARRHRAGARRRAGRVAAIAAALERGPGRDRRRSIARRTMRGRTAPWV